MTQEHFESLYSTSVHYIWMGNLSTNNNKICCTLGPKSLAKFMNGSTNKISINLWVSDNLIQDAEKLLIEYLDRITIRSVDKFLKGNFQYINSMIDIIKQKFNAMETQQFYVAQKDLLSGIILAEYGGYFLDCTTRFVNPPHLPIVDELKVMLPNYCINRLHHYFSPWLAIDVWGFACKAGNPIILDAIQIQLLSAVERNSFPLSLRDAIPCYFGDYPEKNVLENYSFETQNNDAPYRGWIIKELNLQKLNIGSWRESELDEYRIEVYKELNLTLPTNLESCLRNRDIYIKLNGEVKKLNLELMTALTPFKYFEEKVITAFDLHKEDQLTFVFGGKLVDSMSSVLNNLGAINRITTPLIFVARKPELQPLISKNEGPDVSGNSSHSNPQMGGF